MYYLYTVPINCLDQCLTNDTILHAYIKIKKLPDAPFHLNSLFRLESSLVLKKFIKHFYSENMLIFKFFSIQFIAAYDLKKINQVSS